MDKSVNSIIVNDSWAHAASLYSMCYFQKTFMFPAFTDLLTRAGVQSIRTRVKFTSPAARPDCASGHGTAGARPVDAVADCALRPHARRLRERRLAAARGCAVANCIAQAERKCVRGNRVERGPRQAVRACGSAGAPAAKAVAAAGHWTPPARKVPARGPARCRLR